MSPTRAGTRPFTMFGEDVRPGSRRRIELPAGRLPSGTLLSLPVEVLHGTRAGPAIWLSGAIHGDEIVGVEIIRKVAESIDPALLAGTLVAVPVVNVFGFVFESRYLPDRRDLNRSFPGSKRGSLAARLARLFLDEVVSKCDVGIDFHAGSDDRTNLPQIRGNLDDDETLRLALAFCPPVVIHQKTIKGSLRAAAVKMDKRVLLYEGGEPRRFSVEAVEAGVAGTLRTMAALGMIDAAPEGGAEPPFQSRSTTWVRAPRGGIFRPETSLGARVRKGERIGTITEPTQSGGTPVRAQATGVVVGLAVNPLVNPGNGVAHIARPSK